MFRDKRRKRRKSSKIFFSQFTNEKDKENRDMFEIILMNEYCWWKILIKNCLTLSLQFQLSIKDRSKRRLLFNILDKHSHESRIYKFYDIYTIKHVYKKKQTKNRINFLQFLLIKRLFKIISRFQRVRAARLNKIRYEIKRATNTNNLCWCTITRVIKQGKMTFSTLLWTWTLSIALLDGTINAI